MAKFDISIDSSGKVISVMKDGNQLDPDSFAISSYKCKGGMDGKTTYNCVGVAYSMIEADGMNTNRSMHFDTIQGDSVDETDDEYSMAKEIKKVHQRVKAAKILSKSLKNKK